MMNRRGEEFAEAAIVLPLLILTILSMIMAAVFLFGYHEKQSEAHIALMKEVSSSQAVFGVRRRQASASDHIRGTAERVMSRSGSFRAYEISQADAFLLGELVNG